MLNLAQAGGGTNLTRDLLGRIEAMPGWLAAIAAVTVSVGIAVALISVVAMFSVWLERKVSGHIQCRFGPMRVGWHGWLQPIADGVKLLLKEDIVPRGSDRILFMLAPALVLASLLAAIAVLPLAPPADASEPPPSAARPVRPSR